VPDAATIDKNLAKRLANTVRRLTSDKPNEVAEAAKAFGRILQNAGNDVIFGIAERIENENNDKLSDVEMQEVFDAGVAHGKKLGAKMQAQTQQAYLQFPPAFTMATYCAQRKDQLHKDNERKFIDDMLYWARRGPLSPRRQTWLEDIYVRLGGSV
jgi:hypothetical protein